MRIIKIPANSVSTAITQFDDGAPGQVVTVYTSDSTHASSIADGGNFVLAGGVAWAPDTAGDNITLLTTDGVTWIEMCRSNT
jgi:N-acetylglucosamine-6-phosphate deacetylase